MRAASAWRRSTVVTVVMFLTAGTGLAIRAGAAWTAHDAAGRPGASHRSRGHRSGGGRPSASRRGGPDVPAPAHGHAASRSPASRSPASRSPASRSPASRSPASRSPASGRPASVARLTARLASALAPIARRHQGRMAAGVTDPATGRTAIWHARWSFHTASIVKADILAVLLLRHEQARTPLSKDEHELAAQMIEDSDNDAATALWDAIQGGPGLAAGNAALGITGITPGPGGYWGLTATTVGGQLHLLSVLTSRHSPLRASARRYELHLMRHVEPGQDWGVSAAATGGTRTAVKNGWLPDGPQGLWIINSIGVLRHHGHRLLITILSSGQPTRAAGIRQVQAAARAAAAAITATSSEGHAARTAT